MEKTMFAYSWHQTDDETKNWSKSKESLRIYGITDEGKTTCLIVNDFKPFVHIELPSSINWRQNIGGRPKVQKIMDYLNFILGDLKPVKNRTIFIDKYKLYGSNYVQTSPGVFQRKKFPYLVLFFESRKHIKNLEYKLKNNVDVPGFGKIKLNVRETNVSPILQLCVERNLPSAGWIGFKVEGRGALAGYGELVEDKKKFTDCDEEYIISKNYIYPIDKHVPVKAKVMAWDIEVYSEDGNFPDATKPGNVVFQISCIFFIVGTSYKQKYLLTLGDPLEYNEKETIEGCGKDTIVYKFKTEEDLIIAFSSLQKREKPHITTGWNIFNFDTTFLLKRAKLHRCLPNFLLQGFPKDQLGKEKEVKWQSKAYGTTDLKFIDCEGILCIDLMDAVQKEHKLDSYALNFVAKHFLGSKKDDLKPREIFICYREGIKKEVKNIAIHPLSNNLNRYLEKKEIIIENKKFKKPLKPFFRIQNAGVLISDEDDSVFHVKYRGEVFSFLVAVEDSQYEIKTVSDFNNYKNIYGTYTLSAQKAMAKVGKYCVQDSVLVADIFEHLQTWLSFSEMSRTCTTPIMTIHVHGQQVKFFNQVYKYCYDHKTVTDKETYKVDEKERYRGAEVFDPVPGLKRNVVPLDFASLYPSLIIARNMCYSTFVDNDDIPDEMCHVMEWDDHVACIHDPKVIRKNEITEELEKLKKIVNAKKMYTQGTRTYKKMMCSYLVMDNTKEKSEMSKHLKDLDRENNELLNIVNQQTPCYIESIKKKISDLTSERSEITKKLSKSVMCVSNRRYRFLKEPKGILPTIIQNLLDARKNTRTEIKNYKLKLALLMEKENKSKEDINEITFIENLLPILDKRQNSYKISANSMYGATGVRVGALPFMPIAMCTTYMGRKSIVEVSQYLKELGGRVVYGDTDSNYVTFDDVVDKNVKVGTEEFSREMKKLWNHAIEIAKIISKKFDDPITLEFENAIYFKFLILTKKRYMYYTCGKDGNVLMDANGKPKMGRRGVILSRRDNCKYMKDVYADVIDKIFDEQSENEILNGVVEKTLDLYTRQIEFTSCEKDENYLQNLIVTKSVGDYGGDKATFEPVLGKNEKGEDKWKIGNYVVPLITDEIIKTCGTNGLPMTQNEIKDWYLERLPCQVQLEVKIKRRGHNKEEGQRLSYVVTDIGCKGKQSEKIESVEYFKAHSKVLKLDYGYYIERLIEPLDQVFQAVFKNCQKKETIYSANFQKTKLFSIFEKRGKHLQANFTKELHKLCSVTKPKLINEIKSFSKPDLVFL